MALIGLHNLPLLHFVQCNSCSCIATGLACWKVMQDYDFFRFIRNELAYIIMCGFNFHSSTAGLTEMSNSHIKKCAAALLKERKTHQVLWNEKKIILWYLTLFHSQNCLLKWEFAHIGGIFQHLWKKELKEKKS